jgi:hypothetical protein
MLFDDLLRPFLDRRPVAVMARACLEQAFAADDLNDLFARVATTQYEHRLTFAALVDLLGAVVTRRFPSVHAAYRADPHRVGVALASVYAKLNATEPALAEALVAHTARRMHAVLDQWPGDPQPFPGLRLKVVDGNYLAGTDRRLAVLRGHGAAALPGMGVVIRDHATGLLTDLIAREDAYVNERSLIEPLLARIGPGEVIVADRNFCVRPLFVGLAERGSYFAIRHHAGTGLAVVGDRRRVGATATGEVFEQAVRVGGATYRCVTVVLAQPTRDGDREVRVLTNLPAGHGGVAVAEAYRLRWTLEATFLEATRAVQGELNTLGYPRAAVLTFGLALCACNALRVVVRALAVAQGVDHAGEEPSSYYVANEWIAAADGLAVVVPESVWAAVRGWTAAALGAWLVAVAGRADWGRYRKTTRGPKKPVVRTTAGRKAAHRATARLLLAGRNRPKRPPPP